MTSETLKEPEVSPPDRDEAQDELESELRQFVTFILGAEVFAVDMAPVQEIIRVPEVVRVPLAPPSLDGLANLRGQVLPIISLRHLFGLDARDNDDTTRALVIDIGQPLGFVVDRVASVVGVEPSKIEAVGAISSTVDTELLSGLIKDVGGHTMIMVLDFARLIGREFAEIASLATSAAMVGELSSALEAEDEEDGDELQLVSFEVAGQEYAIAIENVQEIVQVPERIVEVPRSEQHVLGVMSLRNRLLPLVSLRRMFALPPREADDHSRIVVVSLGSTSVGVVMDRVNEVLRVAKDDVEAMPGLLARDSDLAEISDICRLDGGERLVSIISTDHLFRHSAIEEALTTVDILNDEERQAAASQAGAHEEVDADDDEQVVVFRLDKEEFGVPIESVQEIVRVPDELTHVPKAPAFVEGVINLRGSVLPVIDLRRRLGLADVERSDRQRVMVFLLEGARTGFIVDSVAEVLKIPREAIEPAPRLSGEQAELLARMANLGREKRLVQLIDPTQLIQKPELADLAELSA
ncbi:chemotaxis protein CheW [Thiorhodococcus minor]|uniref:Chemotaxis protein CheW n=1 Tax=Thiorhodococcus minor TaxID=57489 RepID=A0A6M0K338_9GAMM|nr:chemotaxis protein CheW [Thiorhodococcus minor]NEV62735.1 chemotaxis protein CheW [Thiorhodococcus minor]